MLIIVSTGLLLYVILITERSSIMYAAVLAYVLTIVAELWRQVHGA